MTEDQSIDRSELLALTAEIVAAHVGNNAIAGPEVGALIQSIFDMLKQPGDGRALGVCGVDAGGADQAVTPEQYRARWGLKPDYPMVAPACARKRQELAKKIGLGRKPRSVAPAPKPKAKRSRTKAVAA